jgi:hypothetical protein
MARPMREFLNCFGGVMGLFYTYDYTGQESEYKTVLFQRRQYYF